MPTRLSVRRALVGALATILLLPACGDSDDSDTRSAPNGSVTSTTRSERSTTSSTVADTTTTSAPKAEGTVITLTATAGKVDGGAQRKKVGVGDTVTIRVTSDEAEEIHVHGYDLKEDLQPGQAGAITFTADIPGVFEVELEKSGDQLLELEVS